MAILAPPTTVPEPVTAEVVPPPPSPWRFGLKALLGLMAVCSVQFAAMNYLGVFGGIVLGLFACGAAFTAIVLASVLLTGERARVLPQLDAIVVRLMLAMVVLVIGSILAGGGTAAYSVLARLRTEGIVEDKLGLSLKQVQVVRDDHVVWGLQITDVGEGGVAHQAGLMQDEVIVVEGTVAEFMQQIYANRGKQVDVNVATGALSQSVQNCPQRSVTLNVPP